MTKPKLNGPVIMPELDNRANMANGRADQFTDVANTAALVSQALSDPPNFRTDVGLSNRKQQIMTWRLPNGSNVQMYINPQNLTINEKKLIQPTRTKGGYVVQYWGEDLTRITISGITGSSGVKGVQVLRDIYRSEHDAFELVAASQFNSLLEEVEDHSISDADIANKFLAIAEQTRKSNFIMRPTLASLALSVMLFYQGIQYRGFFTDMQITESTDNLGMFSYTINFSVTETRGTRNNFMAWHKEPLADDAAGQLVSGVSNVVGNTINSLVGLPTTAKNPPQFHPENAPLTFGGSTLVSSIFK